MFCLTSVLLFASVFLASLLFEASVFLLFATRLHLATFGFCSVSIIYYSGGLTSVLLVCF